MTTKKRIYVYGTYFGDIDENQMLSQKIANAMSHMNYWQEFEPMLPNDYPVYAIRYYYLKSTQIF